MRFYSSIIDDDTGYAVKVTQFGQLVTAPADYSTTVSQKMNLVNTAFNFIAPQNDKQIVITDIMLYANKDIGPNDALVDIYCSDVGPTDLGITASIIDTEMLKQTHRDLTGLNILAGPNMWVNGKTNDASIFVTLGYYFIPVT